MAASQRPTAPKLLLVTQGDPLANGVCEIFLRDLASHYPPGRLVRYTLVAAPDSARPSVWLGFPSLTRRIEASARPLASSWQLRRFRRHAAPAIASEIRNLVQAEQIDSIWLILNSANTIYVAEHLLRDDSTPLAVTVWDDPEFLAHTHYLDPWTTRDVVRSFTSVLRRAHRLGVASDGMRAVYAARYGVEGIPLMHGLKPSLWRSVSTDTTSKKLYEIGFAGSLYSKREWNALVAAVARWNQTEPSQLRIRFIGRFPRLGARSAPFIDAVGPLSLGETIDQLAATDMAYVPYWFSPRRQWAVKTAFPSKLSAYVAAGVPVMYHGPRDSTPAEFLQRYKVGLACHTLEIEDILRTLRTLLLDLDFRALVAREQPRALEERLGAHAMLRAFAELLDIDRSLLLPSGADGEPERVDGHA
jgi:hypothetical protein